MIVLNTADVVRTETSPGDLRDRRTCVLAGLTPAGPDLPSLLLRDPDLTRIVRRSGGTITRDGQPLTTAGWCRIRRWRQDWLALPSQVIPVVIGPDHVVRSGAGALRYLAGLCAAAHGEPQLPAQAGTTGDHHQFPGTALAREYTV